jgi:hypothetical protein
VLTPPFTYTNHKDGKSQMVDDLQKDPNEYMNVANDPEYSEPLRKMSSLLKQRHEEATRFRREGV